MSYTGGQSSSQKHAPHVMCGACSLVIQNHIDNVLGCHTVIAPSITALIDNVRIAEIFRSEEGNTNLFQFVMPHVFVL